MREDTGDAGRERDHHQLADDSREVLRASSVARPHRSARFPVTVWMTGLSGAGKSSIADAVERELRAHRRGCCVLDSDRLRHGLNRDLGFSPQARTENVRRVAEVARLINDAGFIVIAALISPFLAHRQLARDIVGPERFLEAYVSTPLNVCESRDPKGLYERARAGQLPEFTGLTSPYEPPEAPDLMLDTSVMSLPDAVFGVVEALRSFDAL